MSHARYAGFRRLRGFGWTVALPIAAIIGMVVGLLFGSTSAGLITGAGVSLFGLIILAFGYSLGEIWDDYWMIPVALAGAEIALITYVSVGQWLWVLVGTAAFIVMAALIAAINRTAEGEGGMLQLLRHFVRSLIPGRYSR